MEKNGVAAKAPLRTAYKGSMHPSGCTALASARAHRICIFVCNVAWFHPCRSLFLGTVVLFPSSSLILLISLFLRLLSSFLDLPHFRLHRVVSLRLILCSDFAPSSVTRCTWCTLILSLSSPRAHRHLFLVFFAHSPPFQRPSSSRLFSHFYIRRGKALPYPKNNPRRGISYDLYTYVSEGGKEEEERHGIRATDNQPRST